MDGSGVVALFCGVERSRCDGLTLAEELLAKRRIALLAALMRLFLFDGSIGCIRLGSPAAC